MPLSVFNIAFKSSLENLLNHASPDLNNNLLEIATKIIDTREKFLFRTGIFVCSLVVNELTNRAMELSLKKLKIAKTKNDKTRIQRIEYIQTMIYLTSLTSCISTIASLAFVLVSGTKLVTSSLDFRKIMKL